MFVACRIWCLADVSSVSPSSEHTVDQNIEFICSNRSRVFFQFVQFRADYTSSPFHQVLPLKSSFKTSINLCRASPPPPPPHFFGNFKDLLRTRCFQPPPPPPLLKYLRGPCLAFLEEQCAWHLHTFPISAVVLRIGTQKIENCLTKRHNLLFIKCPTTSP